uniref:Paraneoplastic antigen Ma-like C-terminal domain-containing protein n=1 Tax=Haplochromis burtoni TaxID=8153 RepID=A0A3Q3BUY4_HAPBU
LLLRLDFKLSFLWCRGEGLEEAKALLVLVTEEVEIAQIEETLETIKCLGRVRVRGHLFHTPLSCLMVLCECKQSIPKDNDYGRHIQSLLISLAPPQPSSDPSINSTESVLQVVGDFLEKAHKSQAEGGYWRLRLFSGNLPVPPSEDPFDHWLEQAWLMVEERDCTDKEKRHRLMESLKGPALEIAKSVRESDPEAGPVEYLEALESTFGSAESGDDLYFAFCLMRLERALTKVSKPPTFLHLLSEIRTEEECEASRRKLNTSVQHVQTKPSGTGNTEYKVSKLKLKSLRPS